MGPAVTSNDRITFRRRLLAWFSANARPMPWRRTKDPYAIWVSEIILQQTRVEQGTPYYQRFVAAFPDVAALAGASQDQVLKLWEGLGYYSRARNLHACAKKVAGECAGIFPKRAEELRTLPGIGPYTAAAIASIAFNEPVPVLDGNVVRVLTRVYDIDADVAAQTTKRELEQHATALLSKRRPGDFNQALMELGAIVCTPRNPRCPECPIRAYCAARQKGMQEQRPKKKTKKAIPHHEIVVGVLNRKGRVLIGQRPPEGLLGGLWEFPGGKVEPGETHAQALQREFLEETGLSIRVGGLVATVRHAYSHFRITLHAYRCSAASGNPQPHFHTALKWANSAELEGYAFPTANRKFLHLI